MSLRWVEGFESYSNLVGQLANRYAIFNAPNAIFGTGRAIGNSLQMNGSALVTPAFANNATWIVGFAFKNINLPTSNVNMSVLEIRDATTAQVTVTFNPSTLLFSVYRGATVLGTGTSVVSTGSWYYVEFLATISSSVGVAHLKVNGIDQVNLSGANTQVSANAYGNTVALRGPAVSSLTGAFQIDDMYICDGAGTVNNTFLGDMKVEAVNVIDSGDFAQWTCNVPNVPNFEAAQVLNDGIFVASNTVGQEDTYLCSKLNFITSNIAGVQSIYWSRNTDSTQHSIAPVARISVTDYTASPLTITDTAIKAYQTIWENDPSTSAPWSIMGVDSTQFGMQLSS
jgi:hypothetical protein